MCDVVANSWNLYKVKHLNIKLLVFFLPFGCKEELHQLVYLFKVACTEFCNPF